MKKQTSIEWLEQEFLKLETTVGVYGVMYELIDKAKAMHKEEIEDAFFGGINDTGEGRNGEYANGNNPNVETVFRKEYEQYYNKTYGGGKDE